MYIILLKLFEMGMKIIPVSFFYEYNYIQRQRHTLLHDVQELMRQSNRLGARYWSHICAPISQTHSSINPNNSAISVISEEIAEGSRLTLYEEICSSSVLHVSPSNVYTHFIAGYCQCLVNFVVDDNMPESLDNGVAGIHKAWSCKMCPS